MILVDCEKARNGFIEGMKGQDFRCWKNTNNLEVGCAAPCADNTSLGCQAMNGHWWEGGC